MKGVDGGDCERGVGGENRRANSLRNGVHHANAVVWGPVYGTNPSVTAAAAESPSAATRVARSSLPDRISVRRDGIPSSVAFTRAQYGSRSRRSALI